MKKLYLLLFITLFALGSAFAADGTRFLHQPDISADKIVFEYGGDLWIVPVTGGEARHLTTHPGNESSPKFSPNGRWIAFTGSYDGNTDVFVIPAEGGVPRRLTYHPGSDNVRGWSPDGSKIMFNSSRDAYSRSSHMFTIDFDGGLPEMLPMPMASLGDYAPDGKHIAYTPIGNAFSVWKRYRGGRTTPVWLLDLRDYSHVEIPHTNASDTYPIWLGDTVYFLSDRNNVMNMFGYNTETKELTQLVNHGVTDIKYLSGGAEKLIYENNGYLHIYDTKNGISRQVEVSVPADQINIRPYYKTVNTEIRSSNLSPTGARAVFEAHGEILTVPAKKGDIRNLTQSPGAYDRYPSWSPDGEHIAYFSDVDGEYALYIVDQFANEPPKKVTFQNPTFYYNPVWSPDGKKIAYSEKNQTLWYLDVDLLEPVKVADNVSSRNYDWSPDSKWIAYTPSLINRFRVISVYSLEHGGNHQITDGMSDSYDPAFSRDGKYLYFIASTNSGQVKGGLDMTSTDRSISWNIYITVLRSDLPSPFAPESDEEKPKEEEKETEKKPEEKVPFRIDLENIDQRILSMPVGSGNFSQIKTADGDKVFFRDGSTLRQYDMNERKADDFMSGVSSYTISADGKKLLYRAGQNWGIVSTTGKPSAGAGRIDVSTMEVQVDPPAEWDQIFNEAWRINRDFFYDPYMHGLDWEAVRIQYAQWIPDVYHRSDLNYVIGEMLGELSVGHSRVGGGAPGTATTRTGAVSVGLLGADYEIVNSRYQITKVYSGLNWNPGMRAPLTEPGVNVKSGDYILKVNGKDLQYPTNIYSMFEKTSGKQVTLHVNSVATLVGSRVVTVVPTGSERSLRNRDWIEGNRKKVDEMTNGRVGYIYLPDTGGGGYTQFNRYFFAQLDKEGLVIDERFNGGGKVADYILEILDRPLMSYWSPREGPDYASPFHAMFGPKVMIINEYAGSGGDWMPYYFSERGIGPLVGKRTWGGLVGTSGVPNLMDGGSVTAPGFAIFSPDGEWIVENVGVYPDYEVEMTPAAVMAGRDPQLEKAVEVVLEEIEKNPFKKTPRPKYPDKTIKK